MPGDRERGVFSSQSCDFTAHMCTGIILSNYKLFVNPLFKLISIEHVIIGSNMYLDYTYYINILEDAYGC